MYYITGAQLGGVRGGGLPYPFLKSKESALILEKNALIVCILYVTFTIQNVVLRVSKRKNFKIFPCGAFFSDIFDEIFIRVP